MRSALSPAGLARTLVVCSAGPFLASLFVTGPTYAQASGVTVPGDYDLANYRHVRAPQTECGGSSAAEDVIVVCGRRDETEEYTSVIPPPVDMYGDVREPVDVSTLPPCVHAPPLSFCMKGIGGGADPAVMVDVTAFPAPLPEGEAAAVSRAD